MLFSDFVRRFLIFTIGFFLIAALPLTNVFHVPNVRLYFFGATVVCFVFLMLSGIQIKLGKLFLISTVFFAVVLMSYPFTRAPNYALLKITQMFGYFYILPLVLTSLIQSQKQESYFNFGLCLAAIFFNCTLYYYYGAPYTVLKSAGRFFRLTLGDDGNPIMTARYLGLGIIVSVFYMCSKTTLLLKIFFLILAIVSSTYLISTGSKGPTAALLLSLMIFIFFAFKNRITISILFVFCIFLITLAILTVLPDDFLTQRFTSKIDNLSGRLPVLLNTLNYLSQSNFIQLIFGHGLGDFGYYLLGRDARMYPHNLFVEIMFESGFLGLTTFLIWMIYPIIYFYKENKFNVDRVGGLLISLYVFSVINAQSSGDLPANFFIPIFAALLISHTDIVKTSK